MHNIGPGEGEAMSRLSRTLSALGDDFLAIATKARQNAVNEDIANARVSLISGMDLYTTQLQTSLPQDMPRHLWGDMAGGEFDRLSNSVLSNMVTKRGKKQFETEFARERVKLTTRATIAGMILGNREMKAGLSAKMVSFVEAGKIDDYFNFLDEILPPDQAFIRKEQAAKYHVANTARQLFDTEGVEAAIAYVKQQDGILDSKERGDLVGQLTLTAKKLNVQMQGQSQLAVIETVDKYYDLISKGELIDPVELSVDEEKFGFAEWNIWKKINTGQGTMPAVKTDPKILLKLHEMLFSAWTGLPRSEEDEILIKTRFAQAYYANKTINSITFDSLNRMLAMEIKPTYVKVLSSGFDRIVNVINKEGWIGDQMKLFKSEAQSIVDAQTALTQWVVDETGRKKDVSVEAVQNQAEKYAIIFNSSEVKKLLKREPKTEAEFEKLVQTLGQQRGSLGLAYYNRWVDKFRRTQ